MDSGIKLQFLHAALQATLIKYGHLIHPEIVMFHTESEYTQSKDMLNFHYLLGLIDVSHENLDHWANTFAQTCMP